MSAWWIFFWIDVALWFGSFFVLITCLCKAAKRGDDMAARIERRLAPYGNQAEEDYVARRLIAEATATMPISLLEQWVEQ